jgi:DtxR family Mn-dependent transcriptional regulator
MPDGFHPPLEEYLETIHDLTEEGVDVIQARLVERLGHSPQAVSEMVRRLVDDGYIVRVGRGVALSESGRERAASVVRKHRLAERFLVDIVGLAWEKAHEEAGRWEHVISADVEARFVEILGNPTTCPHGNPIPGTPLDSRPQTAMADLEAGVTVRLARISELIEIDRSALHFLSENGLVPGQDAHVRTRGPDGTLTLELIDDDGENPRTVAIGPAMSRQMFVTAV